MTYSPIAQQAIELAANVTPDYDNSDRYTTDLTWVTIGNGPYDEGLNRSELLTLAFHLLELAQETPMSAVVATADSVRFVQTSKHEVLVAATEGGY